MEDFESQAEAGRQVRLPSAKEALTPQRSLELFVAVPALGGEAGRLCLCRPQLPAEAPQLLVSVAQ
eukprot:11212686-Lingulodinium_polyedra.AAC.1